MSVLLDAKSLDIEIPVLAMWQRDWKQRWWQGKPWLRGRGRGTREAAMVATVSWDPSQYLKYADERGRPFVELVERIGAIDPHDVVDLGCGPGNLTELLVAKWPGAGIRGVDSSAEMIERAQPLAVPGRLEFEIGDIQTWAPDRPVDVLISNAALHWVADHPALIPRLASDRKSTRLNSSHLGISYAV